MDVKEWLESGKALVHKRLHLMDKLEEVCDKYDILCKGYRAGDTRKATELSSLSAKKDSLQFQINEINQKLDDMSTALHKTPLDALEKRTIESFYFLGKSQEDIAQRENMGLRTIARYKCEGMKKLSSYGNIGTI